MTLIVATFGSAQTVHSSSAVRGAVKEFISPGEATERCIALDHMPGGTYTDEDAAREAELCTVDFYDNKHALCPKVFSTSPGTLIYNLAGSTYSGNPQAFEREACSAGGVNKKGVTGKPISYKMSVNTRESSATFANSSLLYYHFSRYIHPTAHVPVAVFRSIDRREHNRRVSSRGLSLTAGRPALKMNHAGWKALHGAEQNPSSYKPVEELFTPEGLLYGVMLHQRGKRYNAEMNGTRESGWGDGQNRDFQKTAPFRALRSNLSLLDAINEGIRLALQNPKLVKATKRDATPYQMVYWMSDLVDIMSWDQP